MNKQKSFLGMGITHDAEAYESIYNTLASLNQKQYV